MIDKMLRVSLPTLLAKNKKCNIEDSQESRGGRGIFGTAQMMSDSG